MLYLIQVSDTETDTKLLKIGYSDSWENRRSQYINANPLTKFINTREGDEVLERLFHLRYQEFSYPGYGREWFHYDPEIIKGFPILSEEELLDWLWINRSKVLNKDHFNKKRTVQYQIIEKLYSDKDDELDWRNEFDLIWDKKLCKDNEKTIKDPLLCSFMFDFNEAYRWDDKMKVYCDFLDQYGDLYKTTNIGSVPVEFQNYVNLLGTKRVKALGYKKSELENEYKIVVSSGNIKSLVLSSFSENSVYPSSEVKTKLQELYDGLGIKKTAKATDLEEYFEIEQISKRIGGKVCKVIKVLKKKE